MKIICLDYDGTYTAFPELMELIIQYSKKKGYSVILVTMRFRNEEDSGLMELSEKLDAIYYTGRKAKQPYLEKLGIKPDIWIDDSPKWLLNDAIN